MIFKNFRKDLWYLPKVHFTHLILFTVINVCWMKWGTIPSQEEYLFFLPTLLLLSSVQIEMVFLSFFVGAATSIYSYGVQWVNVAAVAGAVLITVPLSSLLHNAAHKNIRPQWLGRILGEISGLMQLSCFADWVVVHVLHHAHSDDPELDPHPPAGLTYIQFVRGMRLKIVKVLSAYYFKNFGQKPEVKSALKTFSRVSRLRHFAWIVFWFSVLGPQLFVFGFVCSIGCKMLHHAWFNWSTHKPSENGQVKILNLDHGVYRLVNAISANFYYHGNHHINMRLLNPKNLQPQNVEQQEKQAG